MRHREWNPPLLQSESVRKTAFTDGLQAEVDRLVHEMQALYRNSTDPWVIGYSGGKDSTAITQLAWMAIEQLPPIERTKPIYIVTTDTLVENPVVANWVNTSLEQMRSTAEDKDLPIQPHLLTPAVEDSFWVNLIGKGYPAPRHKFRWCTERLKIKPTSVFIADKVSVSGEVVLFLGARSAESAKRASSLNKRKEFKTEDFGLTPHPDLVGCQVYTPIADWGNDDVWQFLLNVPNPWSFDNKQLMAMYRGATADNECPIVVDTSTPSCGKSRFGCWVCTLVDEDKSMSAMIQNDAEKEWMLPLLHFRNELDFRGDEAHSRDRERRDFRRISGVLTHYGMPSDEERQEDPDWLEKVRLVPGPYVQDIRAYFLKSLFEIQQFIRKNPESPPEAKNIVLLRPNELREIRRIWLEEKHEIEDLLPKIYEEVFGEPYPMDEGQLPGAVSYEDLSALKLQCGDDRLHYEMIRNLLDVEWQHRLKGKRVGVFRDMHKVVESCFFNDADDALAFKKRELEARMTTMSVSAKPKIAIDIISQQPDLFDTESDQ